MTEVSHAQFAKAIERDNVITFKKRAEPKSNFKSATDDEDGESAPSLKASSNPPLPDIQKDRRKLIIKPFGSLQVKNHNNFVEKEVRQHDNILLKQRNNMLSSENLKLKTRVAVLERQNQRMQKILENDNHQIKPNTSYGISRDKIKPTDSTLRAVIRGLRKELEDLKKQNINIKTTVKFTNLKELQTERDHLAEETIRLRLTLDQEMARRTSLKTNNQGVSVMEHRILYLTDKNNQLAKQLSEVSEKCKKMEEGANRVHRVIDNDKKNAKALQNAILQIRQKQAQIEQLKGQLKTSHSIPSAALLPQTPKENKFDLKRPSIQRKPKAIASQSKAISEKITSSAHGTCQKCQKLENQNKQLAEKIKKLEADLQKQKGSYGELPKGPIAQVQPAQVEQVIKFLTLRFKAHRLSYEQSEKYLINCETAMTENQLTKDITVRQLMESLFVEPFCIVSNRSPTKIKGAIAIDDAFKLKKQNVLDAYHQLLPKYNIMSQEKEQQMFIQVAELITTYYQQILAALTSKRNGQGTISEQHFLQFFKQIQLQQEYTDFIITQIILESLDMEHLNFYAMFQIFYMPQMAPSNGGSNPTTQKKKRFEVQHEHVVHEQEEEYEESKSHLGSRNKTIQNKDKQEEDYGWDEQDKEKSPQKQTKKSILKQQNAKKEDDDVGKSFQEEVYQQQFQEEKEIVEQQLQ